MGLFNLLKNGLTIEKKRKEIVEEPEEEVLETAEEEITPDEEIPAPAAPAPETAPAATINAGTPLDKQQRAECILYGNAPAAPAQVPTPTPTPVAEPEPIPVQRTYNAYSTATSNFNNALLGPTSANQNLLVITPKSADEISAILTNLASGNACIVSLAKLTDAQRHLDYICGFMNAIGGTIMQRTQTEYILTPKGVGIKS